MRAKSSTESRTTSLTGSTASVRKIKQRTATELEQYRRDISIDDHLISLPKLQDRYNTDLINGLSIAKANILLETNGPNSLSSTPPKSSWLILAQFMFGGFAVVLWAGAILSLIGYFVEQREDPQSPNDQLYIAITMILVVVVTGLFGFLQEKKNIDIMESFMKMVPKTATVIREGKLFEIPSEELVIGDLVEVKAGDCVPADIRIISCQSLKVNNSSITGESEMQRRSTNSTDKDPLETQNLAFYSTNVIEGVGRGIVIACGDDTLIGHIASLTSAIEPEELPIKKELDYFIKLITVVATLIGLVVFIYAISENYKFFEAFVIAISIMVANIPEGLFSNINGVFDTNGENVGKKNCLVKNLQAIETLGSTSVICSDKTGTLTQNRMTVSHMYYDEFIVDVLGKTMNLNKSAGFHYLARVGILCNKAEFKPNQESIPIYKREVIGDASESAVLKAMELYVGNITYIRNQEPKILEIPFNSTNKYQISIHHDLENEKHLLVMKGAPERILERCSTYFSENSTYPFTVEKKKEFERSVLKLAYMGERILGFADLELPVEKFPIGYEFTHDPPNFPLNGLRFVGLMSMIDPPRPTVPYAVEKCRSAGIRVIMVTGDHPITAVAIAKKVGIISPHSTTIYDLAVDKKVSLSKLTDIDREACTAAVVTGAELREMLQANLDNILMHYNEIVFARTSPQQKLKIVESLQRLGSIVAVTGDGVNDSPALKKADIGIAMGIAGSDVSKEAADMILLDDNFSSIVSGVEEGRLIYDNLKKSVAYLLTSNVPEILPFVMLITLQIPQVLSVMAVILIDVGTDLWPAISLAYEQAEADIMSRKPRNPSYDTLVNSRLICLTYLQIGMMQACAGFMTYFIMMARHGFFYDKLIGIRREWDSKYVNDLKDSYGLEWTYKQRKVLQRKGYSAFFLAVVVTQVADSLTTKTRRLSILQQGMTNWVLNFGLIFEIFLAVFVVYCPVLNSCLQFEPVEWYTPLPAVPFAILIVIYDEARRFLCEVIPMGGLPERLTINFS